MSLRDLASLMIGSALLVACGPARDPGGGPDGGSDLPDGGGGAVDGGDSLDGGGPSDDGGSSTLGPALPPGTLLYVRAETRDRDVLVARTLATGAERVVTDLTGDGSSGWNIRGYSLSPDRRRVALASLYGPTAEDNATGLATRRIWTLDTDGTDFRRLTPIFPDTSGGRSSYSLEISDPIWARDGTAVLFDLGEYWYEGTTLSGGTAPWIVEASGSSPPSSVPTPFGCSIILTGLNPATGEILLNHSVCVPGQGSRGLYLYPPGGGSSPTLLVESSHVSGGIDIYLEQASWLADGSGFLFLGGTETTDWTPSILAYDMTARSASLLLPPPPGSSMRSVTISPDASMIVYCLADAEGRTDLHAVDLIASPPTDTAITHDGQSCHPSF
jgi:hypothetical protein